MVRNTLLPTGDAELDESIKNRLTRVALFRHKIESAFDEAVQRSFDARPRKPDERGLNGHFGYYSDVEPGQRRVETWNPEQERLDRINSEVNLRVAHSSCNLRKHDKLLSEL